MTENKGNRLYWLNHFINNNI